MEQLVDRLASVPSSRRRALLAGAAIVAVLLALGVSLTGTGLLATIGGSASGTVLFFAGYGWWTTCLSDQRRARWDVKGRWPAPTRRTVVAVTFALVLIGTLLSDAQRYLPYAVGGTLFVAMLWAMLFFVRSTAAEQEEAAQRAAEQVAAEAAEEDFEV